MSRVGWSTALFIAVLVASSSGCGVRRTGGNLAQRLGVGTSTVVWSEAIGPRVRVRADFDPEEVREVAAEIEQMMDVLEEVAFPFEERPANRVDVVFFGDHEDYEAGVERRNTGGHYLEYRYGGLDLPPTIFVRGGWDNVRRRTVRHELVHRYVRFYYPQAPTWVNEGLAELYETLSFGDGRAIIGKRGPYSGKVPMPPLRVLFGMRSNEFYVDDPALAEGDRIIARHSHYLAAWMATHYLTTRDSPWRKRFQDYLLDQSQGVSARDAFARHFGGQDLDALEKGMFEHFAFAELMLLHTAYEPKPAPAITLRHMRAAESETLHAWYRARDGSTTHAQSIAALDAVVAAEPGYAEAYYWRGLMAREAGKIIEAYADFQKALSLEPRSPAYLVAVLDLTMADARALPEEQVAERLDALTPALAKTAVSATALLTTSRALSWRGKLEASLGFAVRATHADVGCAGCWEQRAELSWALGKVDAALAATELAIQQAYSAEYAQRLVGRRDQMAAGAAAQRAKAAPPTAP